MTPPRIDPSLHWDHPVAAVRIAVASDPATPADVLRRMAMDADKRVRDAADANVRHPGRVDLFE